MSQVYTLTYKKSPNACLTSQSDVKCLKPCPTLSVLMFTVLVDFRLVEPWSSCHVRMFIFLWTSMLMCRPLAVMRHPFIVRGTFEVDSPKYCPVGASAVLRPTSPLWNSRL